MAAVVKLENHLPVVKFSVVMESSAASSSLVPVVMIDVERGGTLLETISAAPEDLGVPADFDPAAYRYAEPAFGFSAGTGGRIARAVSGMLGLGPAETVWLHLADPVGFLSGLPLERMLRQYVGERPILRVPNFALFPARPLGRIEMALCVSEARARERFDGLSILRGLVPALLDAGSPIAALHLFTDAATYYHLGPERDAAFERFATDTRLVLHDPAGAPSPGRSGPAASTSNAGTAVTNSWLRWMLQELSGVTVDVVHFATNGYTFAGQSALAVADSPMTSEDLLWARFIGPDELATWLSHLGTWAVGFTSPPGNFSPLGLREIADDVARLRPGPIVQHDAALGPLSFQELAWAYAGLLGGVQPAPAGSVAMYVHPAVFAQTAVSLAGPPDSFADTLVNQSLGGQQPVAAPAWVTSTRRYLEQSVARMFPEPGEPTSASQAAVSEGAAQALRFVGEITGMLGDPS